MDDKLKPAVNNAQLVDLARQNIRLIHGKGVFMTRCVDCKDQIKARYTLKNGKIPGGTFVINHVKPGRNPCMPTVLKFDIAAIPGSNETHPIETRVAIEDPFGVRYGSYPCLCGDIVRFAIEEKHLKRTFYQHDKCGFTSNLLLVFDRKHERRTDVHDHIIIPFDSDYAIMGKILDYSKGGANIKIALQKTDHEKLIPYFEKNKAVQIVQYKGDINKSDFPYPYKMNKEDFGFTVLKLKEKTTTSQTADRNKIYKPASIIEYSFNTKTDKTELRIKFP